MNMSRYKQEYYKGETITMRLSGGERLNLDEYGFKLSLSCGSYSVVREKADCIRESEGVYVVRIDCEEAKLMPSGVYDVELAIKRGDCKVARVENVILIKDR